MKIDKFKKIVKDCGYDPDGLLDRWLELNPKENYTEEDFKKVYHFRSKRRNPKFRTINGGYSTKKWQYSERHL